MTCQEFLAGYSDYLDERSGWEATLRWRAHIEVCASCSRYDRVMRRGLELVRELAPPEPSSDFHMALRYRLRRTEPNDGIGNGRASGATAAVPLAIAAAIAALAWSPLLRPVVVPPAAIIAEAPEPAAPTEVADESEAMATRAGDSAAMAPAVAADRTEEGASSTEAATAPFGAGVAPEPRIASGPTVAPVWSAAPPAAAQRIGGAPAGLIRAGYEQAAAAAGSGVAVLDSWPAPAPVWSLEPRSLWPEPERVTPTLWEGPSPLEAWRRSSVERVGSDRRGGVLLLELRSGAVQGSPRLP